MDDILNQFKTFVQTNEQYFKEDLKTIRTGRANPSLIEGLLVEAYGGSTKMKLMEMSTITNEGSSALIVVPFDPSTVSDIEKAILKSPLGVSPQTQGSKITVRIPAMSQEQREKYIKLVSQKAEERKVMIRGQRDEARKKLKALLDTKEISEDEKFRIEKDIDTATQNANMAIQSHRESKEKEIMEV